MYYTYNCMIKKSDGRRGWGRVTIFSHFVRFPQIVFRMWKIVTNFRNRLGIWHSLLYLNWKIFKFESIKALQKIFYSLM